MAKINLNKNFMLIILYLILSSAKYTYTAPTTFNPLELTFKMNITKDTLSIINQTDHLKSQKSTTESYVLRNNYTESETISSQSTTATTILATKNFDNKLKKFKIDSTTQQTKIFSSSLSLDKQQKEEHSLKLISKKFKDKIPSKNSTFTEKLNNASLSQHNTFEKDLEQQTTGFTALELDYVQSTTEIPTEIQPIRRIMAENYKNLDGSVPKDEDTTTVKNFSESETQTVTVQVSLKPLTISTSDEKSQKGKIEGNESKHVTTNRPINSHINENLKENQNSSGISILSRNNSTTKNVQFDENFQSSYLIVKTTTATTTPDYNEVEISRDIQKIPLNNTEDIIFLGNDMKSSIVTTENINDDAIRNSMKKTTEFSTTSYSDTIIENTTPDIEEETKENIVKLFEVEKIDTKSMDSYQQQMTAMLQQNSNVDVNLKKKNSRIVMGHDGVKATKKKQLMEKNFSKDDDSFTKSQIIKISDGSRDNNDDGMRVEGRKLVEDNVDDKMLEKIKDNEDSEYGTRNTSTEEIKVFGHLSGGDGYDNGKTKKSDLEYKEAHLIPLIMGENFLEIEKKSNSTMNIKENGLKDVVDLDTEDSEKFKVDHIPANFDALDIETNTKKVKTNEKLRYIETTNFTNPLSRTKFNSETTEYQIVSTAVPQYSTQIQNSFQHPERQEIVDTLTLASNGDDQNIVNRTDATEPQVVTERSLIPNSFTNEHKDTENFDTLMTTLENIETITMSNYPNTNITIDLFLIEDPMTQKVVDTETLNFTLNFNKSDHTDRASINNDKQNKDLTIISDDVSIINLDFVSSTPESHVSKTKTTTRPSEFNTFVNKKNNDKNQTDFAGIEIQINVSEGTGDGQTNSSQLLEFSFRKTGLEQMPFRDGIIKNDSLSQSRLSIYEGAESQKSLSMPSDRLQNENEYSNESDILVVEITDSGNISDYSHSNSKENERYTDENPKFTIHNDRISDYDSAGSEISKPFSDYENENSKMKPMNRESGSDDDDLFIPDLKLEPLDEFSSTSGRQEKNFRKEPSVDRDSDTIFYISNTEVKVVESKPTSNSLLAHQNSESGVQFDRSKTSINQDLPSIYEEDVIIDFHSKNTSSNENRDKSDQFEEGIILSPLKNNFDPLKAIKDQNLKLFNGEGNKSKNSFAESFIEIEESSNASDNKSPNDPKSSIISSFSNRNEPANMQNNKSKQSSTTSTETNENSGIVSNVIIEPAIIPEISIGVPVIGELPPQIQLKEIDFMPQDGGKDFNIDSENIDDGIQYGGDLIARETNGVNYAIDSGFDFVKYKNKINSNNLGIENSDSDAYNYGTGVTSQIIMHAVDNLQKEQLIAELPSETATATEMRDAPIKRGGGTGMNSTIPEKLGNATAYSVLEESDGEFNFTDLQTLILACFTTLVPLILLAGMGYVVRFLWIKYSRHDSQGGSLVEDNSTDPLAAKSMNLSQDELKSTDSGITINRKNDTLESNTEIQTKYHDDDDVGGGGVGCIVGGIGNGIRKCGDNTIGHGLTQSVSESTNIDIHCKMNGIQTTDKINHSGANGSVITMTLKNNHLIVETEERNDISRDARETKMHYTPSEKDGVFVVEVARGADSKGIPPSPRNENDGLTKTCQIDIETAPNNISDGINKYGSSKSTNHEEVQIHQPPSDGSNDDVDYAVPTDSINDCNNLSPAHENGTVNTHLGNSNTGLSQSDLSTSSEDSNKGYTYGNQQLYEADSRDSYIEKSNSTTPAMIKSPSFTPSGKIENESHTNGNSILNHNMNNSDFIETKPIIKAALLKQDTVIEVISTTLNSKIPIKNTENGDIMIQPNQQNKIQNTNGISISPSHNGNSNNNNNNNNGELNETENGFDSIISLPAPPSTEEIKQLNDIILSENTQLDSLPPPPPPTEIQESCNSNGNSENDTVTNRKLDGIHHDSHSTETQNGVAVVSVTGSS